MKKEYIIYKTLTGQITKKMNALESSVLLNVDSGEAHLEGTVNNFDDNYIDISADTVEVIARPVQSIIQDTDTITADGVAVSTFTGIAENSEVFIDNVLQGAVDATGTVSISFDAVGVYSIKFVLFPNLDAEFTVNAN